MSRVRDPHGRYSAQADAITAALASRATEIRDHVEQALSLYAGRALTWTRPDFGGVVTMRAGARGVIGGTAFLSLIWGGRSMMLGMAREPMVETVKAPVAEMLEQARRHSMRTAVVGSTVAAWIALEHEGAPLTHVYRPDRDPAFVAVHKLMAEEEGNA